MKRKQPQVWNEPPDTRAVDTLVELCLAGFKRAEPEPQEQIFPGVEASHLWGALDMARTEIIALRKRVGRFRRAAKARLPGRNP